MGQHNHRRHRFVLLALALSVGLTATAVSAQEHEGNDSDDSTWGLGLGVTSLQRPYRDIEDEVKIFPLITYESERFSVGGSRFDFKLNHSERLSFRIRARYTLDGYDSGDSDFLRGMRDRKDSAWFGAAVEWQLPFAELSAEYLADTMGNSKGARARVQAEHRFAMGRFGLMPRIAAEWVDKKYVNYYYGVLQEEATAERAAYEGKSTVNVEGGLRVDYILRRNQSLFVDVGVVGMGRAIKDSPLVDGSEQIRSSIGYVYRF